MNENIPIKIVVLANVTLLSMIAIDIPTNIIITFIVNHNSHLFIILLIQLHY